MAYIRSKSFEKANKKLFDFSISARYNKSKFKKFMQEEEKEPQDQI